MTIQAAMPNAYFAPDRARLADNELSTVRYRCTIEYEAEKNGKRRPEGGSEALSQTTS